MMALRLLSRRGAVTMSAMTRRGVAQSSSSAAAAEASAAASSSTVADEVRAALQRDAEAQARREAIVDARAVVFAAAASADHRPRIAAAEAFDMAAAALPRAPNLCYVTLSADYAAMLDTPGVLWGSLCKANNVAIDGVTRSSNSSNSSDGGAASSPTPPSLHMLGSAVCRQRPGGGYVQVLLGCVPDLQCDAFTLDTLPDMNELRGESEVGESTATAGAPRRPPPVLCVALLDATLSLQYECALVTRLSTLAQRLRTLQCPLVGGVLPPLATQASAAQGGSSDTARAHGAAAVSSSGSSGTRDADSSLFFVNDRVYRGSAAAVVLRSRLLATRALSVVPSIHMRSVTADEVSVTTRADDGGSDDDGASSSVCVIRRLDGQRATDVVRAMYESDELRERMCKLFVGVPVSHDTATHHGSSSGSSSSSDDNATAAATTTYLPLTFTGDPEGGTLQCVLPPGVQLRSGDAVALLVDDAELDTEAAAGLLVSAEQQLLQPPVCAVKDVVVAREVRRHIVASSTAALHFSCASLNTVARPDTPTLHLGGGQAMYAPSVLQRCVGRSCANAGIFCPGQVATVGRVTSVLTRSSTYAFLQGTA